MSSLGSDSLCPRVLSAALWPGTCEKEARISPVSSSPMSCFCQALHSPGRLLDSPRTSILYPLLHSLLCCDPRGKDRSPSHSSLNSWPCGTYFPPQALRPTPHRAALQLFKNRAWGSRCQLCSVASRHLCARPLECLFPSAFPVFKFCHLQLTV